MPTSSPVTVLITSGPVTNIWLVLSTMITKSVSAGEYTAPPAAGPMMIEIWGMTPDAAVLRRKISPYLPSATTPSWMRAPPESRMPMMGTPVFSARSMTLMIFSPATSPRDPPKMVKSWL
jgi:hypothetical protein